jgi:hypothetical protein
MIRCVFISFSNVENRSSLEGEGESSKLWRVSTLLKGLLELRNENHRVSMSECRKYYSY